MKMGGHWTIDVHKLDGSRADGAIDWRMDEV